ncbi:MAG: thiamine phosphate synthase [Lachnospiraceae bacterium]|nr:thiamine phosphate synthase [Lachnospiraceae bacterium]
MMYDKKNLKKDILLYAVAGTNPLSHESLYHQVEKAIRGGAGMIQLREKHMEAAAVIEEAKALKILCSRYKVPLMINDSVEIARAADADGVHLGQDDGSISEARKKLGPDKIIGVSAHNVGEAVLAWKQGADYLGSGAVFRTGSKDNVVPLAHEELRAICRAVPIPVAAIGGISENNVTALSGTGIAGIAVISAIFAKQDIEKAARELYRLAQDIVNG